MIRLALMLAVGGCADVCPIGGPLLPSDRPQEFSDAPATRIVGGLESRATGVPSWVCSCVCDQPWAEMWVGTRQDPFLPHALPWPMPVRDPYTGRDFVARLVVQVDASADGEAWCDLRHGDGLWSVQVIVDDPL